MPFFFLAFSPFLHLLCNFFPIKLNFEIKFCNKSALKILTYMQFLPASLLKLDHYASQFYKTIEKVGEALY